MTSKFYEVKVLLRSDKHEAAVEQMIADAIEALLRSEKDQAEQSAGEAESLAVKAKRLSWVGPKTAKRGSQRQWP